MEKKNEKNDKQKAAERLATEPDQKSEKEEKSVVLSQKEYNDIKLQVADALNEYKELQRDYENLRNRLREDVAAAKFEGTKEALMTLLPALDSFKKARKILSDKATLSGITLIEKNILTAVKELGVEKIKCLGLPFDPNFHNAMMMMEKEGKQSGTVIEEVEAGYILGDKVIKYSQVIVAK